MTLLSVENINVFYGDVQVIDGLSLHVDEGEVVSIIGGNGAGKSTLLKTISGLLQARSGAISFRGERIEALPPEKIVECGIVHVPEGAAPVFAHERGGQPGDRGLQQEGLQAQRPRPCAWSTNCSRDCSNGATRQP